MKKNNIKEIKKIILIVVLLLIIYTISNLNNISIAIAKPISVYKFSNMAYSTLSNSNHDTATKINKAYTFTFLEDLKRQSSSKNFCIHWGSSGTKGTFKVKNVVDINNNNNFRTAINMDDTTKTYVSRLNGLMAYLAYYGMNDPTGYEKDSKYDNGSDTLWAFRQLYTTRNWRTEVTNYLGIVTYAETKENGLENEVYKNGNIYAEFLNTNRNNINITKESTVQPEVNGNYIGPFRVEYASGGADNHINNKTICKIDGVNYSGKYYVGNELTEQSEVPHNQDFYIYAASPNNVKKVKFVNSYYVYKARIFFFSGGYTQTNITAVGDRYEYSSFVEYDIESQPDIQISKTVYQVNGLDVNADTANVEVGDTVVFKIDITNHGGSTSQSFTLTDTFNSNLIYQGIEDGGFEGTVSGNTYTQPITGINKGETKTKLIKFVVGGFTADKKIINGSTGKELENEAKISGLPTDNKGGTELKDTASVNVLRYNYTIDKSIEKIFNKNMVDTNQKQLAEKGDIILYKIRFENLSEDANDLTASTNPTDVWLRNIVIEDTLPNGLTLKSGTCEAEINGIETDINHNGYWEYNNCNAWDTTYDSTNRKVTMSLKSNKIKASESKTFFVLAEVTKDLSLDDITVSNTAKITSITNRNSI